MNVWWLPEEATFLFLRKLGNIICFKVKLAIRYILCKIEKCQCECLWHLQIQILCWFGLNIRNNPILEQKRLLISSICNFHHYLEAGANFGTFCNLIDHCSPPYFLLETLCCKTFPSDPHLGDVEQLFLSKSISLKKKSISLQMWNLENTPPSVFANVAVFTRTTLDFSQNQFENIKVLSKSPRSLSWTHLWCFV